MVAKKIIIGIAGMPASGKSLVADYIEAKYKAQRIHMGDFVWNFLKKRGIRPSEEMGSMVGLYLWAEYGDIPISDWANKQVKKSKAKIVILDSIRTPEEVTFFRRQYGKNFQVVAILAAPNVRFERMRKRARFGNVPKITFKMRDDDELIRGVGDVMVSANYEIDGNKGKASVKKQTEKIMRSIRGK
ncbi:MAG: AAA family ATPase [DPANN group archaeon]|nr:AAA family ATPase [DPANN group archaeon]